MGLLRSRKTLTPKRACQIYLAWESCPRLLFSSSSSSSSSSCCWRFRRVSCSLIPKMKLVPPSLPRSSYVPSSFSLYCSACFGSLCRSSVRVVATFSGTLLFPLLCSVLPYLLNTLILFFIEFLLFQVGVSNISSVLLLNVDSLSSSVPKLHFKISLLL